jgi:hypothetical protein
VATTASPLLEAQFLERRRRAEGPGVVEEQIDAPELRDGAGEQLANGARIGHVGRCHQRLVIRAADRGERLAEGLLAAAGERDAVSRGQQGARHLTPEARARARHHGDRAYGGHEPTTSMSSRCATRGVPSVAVQATSIESSLR